MPAQIWAQLPRCVCARAKSNQVDRVVEWRAAAEALHAPCALLFGLCGGLGACGLVAATHACLSCCNFRREHAASSARRAPDGQRTDGEGNGSASTTRRWSEHSEPRSRAAMPRCKGRAAQSLSSFRDLAASRFQRHAPASFTLPSLPDTAPATSAVQRHAPCHNICRSSRPPCSLIELRGTKPGACAWQFVRPGGRALAQ